MPGWPGFGAFGFAYGGVGQGRESTEAFVLNTPNFTTMVQELSHSVGWLADPWVWAVVLGALIAPLAWGAFILRKYVNIMMTIMVDRSQILQQSENEAWSGSDENAGDQCCVTPLSFLAADGHRLAGMMLSVGKRGSTKGVVVFAHEVGSDRTSCWRYCHPLLEAGYDVFAFDFRGHGASSPDAMCPPRMFLSDREQADLKGAITFVGALLAERGMLPDVGVFGVSRGGVAAILAAAEMPQVRAVATDGVFSSAMTVEFLIRRFAPVLAGIAVIARNHPPVVWRFFRWLLFRECRRKLGFRIPSVRKAIRRLGRRPILFIHGQEDRHIPVSQCQTLYELARGPKQLWVVPDAKHNQSIVLDPLGYARRIVRFFDEHLAMSSAVADTMGGGEPVSVASLRRAGTPARPAHRTGSPRVDEPVGQRV